MVNFNPHAVWREETVHCIRTYAHSLNWTSNLDLSNLLKIVSKPLKHFWRACVLFKSQLNIFPRQFTGFAFNGSIMVAVPLNRNFSVTIRLFNNIDLDFVGWNSILARAIIFSKTRENQPTLRKRRSSSGHLFMHGSEVVVLRFSSMNTDTHLNLIWPTCSLLRGI